MSATRKTPMKALGRRSLGLGAATALAATALISAAIAHGDQGRPGQGGNAGIPSGVDLRGRPAPAALGTPVPSGNLLVGLAPDIGAGTTDAILMTGFGGTFASFKVPGIFPVTSLAGLTHLPGTGIFSISSGNVDGGQIYHILSNGAFVGVGPTGYASCPALVWGGPAGPLFGVVESLGSIGNSLAYINPFTGAATELDPFGGFGSGITGVDAIAIDPTTGTMYGSTGFDYDGSPGDVITIDTTTGKATDTGIDILDASGNPPICTVAGMCFDLQGTMYVSIGCGQLVGGLGGDVYSVDTTTFTATLLGNVTGGQSVSDLEAIF